MNLTKISKRRGIFSPVLNVNKDMRDTVRDTILISELGAIKDDSANSTYSKPRSLVNIKMEKSIIITIVLFALFIDFSATSKSESYVSKRTHGNSQNALNKSNETRTESSVDKISELGSVSELNYNFLL